MQTKTKKKKPSLPKKAAIAPYRHVSCRATFKGNVTQEQYRIILDYIKDMRNRGFVYEEVKSETNYDMISNIKYVLVKHGS